MNTKNKKSQITLFIILGIVLLAIFVLVFYLVNYVSKAKAEEETKTAIDAQTKLKPVSDYVKNCLEKASEEGLLMIGKQGGYLYKFQGGTVVNYKGLPGRMSEGSDEGKLYINYPQGEDYYVPYLIYPPAYNLPMRSSKPPVYPWQFFPYASSPNSPGKIFIGNFGKSNLLPLDDDSGPHSLHLQLSSFIENNIGKCMDFSIFKEFNIKDIKESGLNASVVFGQDDIAVNLDYPLEVINKNSMEDRAVFNDFYVHIPVRIRKLYNFVDELIENDVSDMAFDAGGAGNGQNSFKVNVIRSVLNNDDIIVVEDSLSNINGKPYEFRFARLNRIPALHWVEAKPPVFKEGEEVNLANLSISNLALNNDKTSILAEGAVFDPDEDIINESLFNYRILGVEDGSLPRTIAGSILYKCNKEGKIVVRISVSDGSLEDYQDIEVRC